MQKKTKQKQDEEVVVITTEVPPEWSRTLKAEARRQKPRLSRKALVYLIIGKAVRRIDAKS
jgi:kynurenine formamidase